MKDFLKVLAIIIVVGISSTLVWAATNEVVSVNIVGYQKIICEGGKLHFASTAFSNPTGGILRSANVFSNQLPNGSSVLAYDTTLKAYRIDNKNFSGWGTNIVYEGGMGFVIKVPSAATSTTYEVTLMGEVPMEGSNLNLVANGLNLMGYPYTASVLWTNTDLAKSAVNGDSLRVWNTISQAYVIYNRNFSGWGAATNLVITPGMGFWFKTASTNHTIIEVRPYNP